MAFQKIPLAEASAKQLADFAEQVLGLDGVDYRLGKGKIEEKMRAALYDKDFIEVEVEEAAIQRIEPPHQARGRRMATVRIHSSESPGGREPVPLAVNGKRLDVPRDQDCTIPWEYYHDLDNAKTTVYEQGPNLEPINPKDVHFYPFSLIHQDPPLPSEVQQKAA